MAKSSAEAVVNVLDQALPDSVILQELVAELRDAACEKDGCARIFVDNAYIAIPINAEMSIIEKALFKETSASIFPAGCRVQVAVGQVKKKGYRIISEYCFAVLFFDLECRRVKLEFRTKMLGYYTGAQMDNIV